MAFVHQQVWKKRHVNPIAANYIKQLNRRGDLFDLERVDETVRRNLLDNSANDIKVNPSSRLEGGAVEMWGGREGQ